MSMLYDTSLLTGAQVVDVAGVPSLANLAASAELTLNTFTLNAHRWVYSRLESNGIDPSLLTNESRLHDAIAFEVVARAASAGQIRGVDGDYFHRRAAEIVDKFRPVYASADTPRRSSEGIPVVGHVSPGLVFSGDLQSTDIDYISDDIPSVQ